MTDFVQDAIGILKFGFSWIRERSMWKFLAAIIAFYLIIGLFETFTSGDTLIAAASSRGWFLLFMLGVVVLFLALTVVNYFLLRAAFQLKGYKVRENSIGTFIRFLLIGLVQAVYAVFSVFDLKLLSLPIVGLLFIATGVVGSISPLRYLGLLLLGIYAVLVVRNMIRLTPIVGFMFTGRGLRESAKLSWSSTAGLAVKTLVLTILLVIPLAIIGVIGSVASTILGIFQNSLLNIIGVVIRSVFSGVELITAIIVGAGIFHWISQQSKFKGFPLSTQTTKTRQKK